MHWLLLIPEEDVFLVVGICAKGEITQQDKKSEKVPRGLASLVFL